MAPTRPDTHQLVDTRWDLVVIGGGITGAGVLLEAARLGLKAVLVEQRDFAWGTSSRSSKMVHGGLRYLAQGDFRLTREALQEREWLIQALPNLVVRQQYLFPVRAGQFPGRWALKAGLWLYDRFAGIRDHHWLSTERVRHLAPGLRHDDLHGAMTYTDALTDDSRLVMQVLHEAAELGGIARNYMQVQAIIPGENGFEIKVNDIAASTSLTLRADKVINATGAWADRLSAATARVRPQRGSHLFVPAARLPVNSCFTLVNPDDGRPVFVFPWEGTTCIGTTDIDHRDALDQEPHCTESEIDYLLTHINRQFPQAQLSRADILSTMAGVRPIIASGKGRNPSAERRDHAVWQADGVVSVSGGKLTTFRLIALDALKVAGFLDARAWRHAKRRPPAFRACQVPEELGNPLAALPAGNRLFEIIAWICTHEQVEHLDDLMLRRTRLGNLLPHGGAAVLSQVATICRDQLGWSETRWQQELERYRDTVARYYGVTLDDTVQVPEKAEPLRQLA
ncbi:MAG: glycerol-3-phosphate dehydrogenase/oxidase [Alcanivoracaceae bacterium]|nr:glycerol-3-phosphate dehydrogenase/oxidase [Alcanivoracaceae bacterium]